MTFVLFRYLLGVILEASNVLSEAVTAIQKQYDGNDFTFQQCKEFIPKTEEAIRTVRVFGCCSEISLRYLRKKGFKNCTFFQRRHVIQNKRKKNHIEKCI